jgi:hypothetical protein
MTNLTKRIYDCETGETIDRDLTKDEIAQHKADQLEAVANKNKIDNAKSAKSALLERLGLTEDEAKLLLS